MPKGEIYHIAKEDRVHFKKDFQKKLLKLTRNKLNCTWVKLAGNILHVTKRMIFNYINESSRLSISQTQKLSEMVGIQISYVLENWVSRVVKKENILSEQGKIGGKYERKISKIQQKKHSREELNEIRKLNLLKTDIVKASQNSLITQEPTLQEREIIKENLTNNLRFNFQKILKKNNEWRCFDFIYYLDSELSLAEEVTSTNYFHRAQILDFVEKYKWLKEEFDIPLIVTFKNIPKRLDTILLLIEEGVIPILDSKDRLQIINICLDNKSDIRNYIEILKRSIKKKIKENLKIISIAAKRESSIIKNNLEKDIHDKLLELGLNPSGKKVIQTIYGTYLIPDNYFELNGQKFCILASSSNSHNSLRMLSLEHAAYSYLIKKLVDPTIKCISVFDYNGKFNFLNNSISLNKRYLLKYSDIILNFKEISKLPQIIKERLACQE